MEYIDQETLDLVNLIADLIEKELSGEDDNVESKMPSM